MQEMKALLLTSADVMRILGTSKSSAEKCIRTINEKEKAAGRIVIRGRVNRYAFYDMVGFPYDKGAVLA